MAQPLEELKQFNLKTLEFFTKVTQSYALHSPFLGRYLMKKASDLVFHENLDFRPQFPSFCEFCGTYLIPGANTYVRVRKFANRNEEKRFKRKLHKSFQEHKFTLSPQKLSLRNKLVYLCLVCNHQNLGAGALKKSKFSNENSNSKEIKRRKLSTGSNKRVKADPKVIGTKNSRNKDSVTNEDKSKSDKLEEPKVDIPKLDNIISDFKIDTEGQAENEMITKRVPHSIFYSSNPPIITEYKQKELQHDSRINQPRTLDVSKTKNKKKIKNKGGEIEFPVAKTLLHDGSNTPANKGKMNLYNIFNP